jgi:hypothetical protein
VKKWFLLIVLMFSLLCSPAEALPRDDGFTFSVHGCGEGIKIVMVWYPADGVLCCCTTVTVRFWDATFNEIGTYLQHVCEDRDEGDDPPYGPYIDEMFFPDAPVSATWVSIFFPDPYPSLYNKQLHRDEWEGSDTRIGEIKAEGRVIKVVADWKPWADIDSPDWAFLECKDIDDTPAPLGGSNFFIDPEAIDSRNVSFMVNYGNQRCKVARIDFQTSWPTACNTAWTEFDLWPTIQPSGGSFLWGREVTVIVKWPNYWRLEDSTTGKVDVRFAITGGDGKPRVFTAWLENDGFERVEFSNPLWEIAVQLLESLPDDFVNATLQVIFPWPLQPSEVVEVKYYPKPKTYLSVVGK